MRFPLSKPAGWRRCSATDRYSCRLHLPGRRSRLEDEARRPSRLSGFFKAGASKGPSRDRIAADRKSVVSGKSVSVRVDLGGRGINQEKETTTQKTTISCEDL